MQQAVKVAEVRNDEMAAASKTGECQNGLPGRNGGNLAPRCWKTCTALYFVAHLWRTGGVGLGQGLEPTALRYESRRGAPRRLVRTA